MSPKRDEKAACVVCGNGVAYWFHHGKFQWTTDQQYAAMTSHCYPFDVDSRRGELTHRVADPEPFVWWGTHLRSSISYEGEGTEFDPRPGYSQDRDDYPRIIRVVCVCGERYKSSECGRNAHLRGAQVRSDLRDGGTS